MIAGIRIGNEEIDFDTTLEAPGIYQEVLGDKQLLVDVNGDWACWMGPAGWFERDRDDSLMREILWVRCPPGSEWVFAPDRPYGEPAEPREKSKAQ